MTDITKTQARLLAVVREYSAEHGFSPSLREIGTAMHASTPWVHAIVQELVDRGHLRKQARKARGLIVVEPHQVQLNPEIYDLVTSYARLSHTNVETAANELLRNALGAA